MMKKLLKIYLRERQSYNASNIRKRAIFHTGDTSRLSRLETEVCQRLLQTSARRVLSDEQLRDIPSSIARFV